MTKPPHPLRFPLAACVLAVLCSALTAQAEVRRLEIRERTPYENGRVFEGVGAYERLLGRVYFAVDPAAAANGTIIDLELAPRNARGEVEYAADVEILAPVDRAKASGTLLYDVNNRGGRSVPLMFHTGADHFLMRRGVIVVASGWIAELLPGGNRLRLEVPVAMEGGRPVTGRVRAEVVSNAAADRINLTNRDSMGSYAPVAGDLASATLTWRMRETDPRVPIPNAQWRLDVTPVDAPGELRSLPRVELVVAGGLHPGFIYELIYTAEGSVVQGLGLAGIRDLVSFLKYDQTAANPLRLPAGGSAARWAIGFGVSQSGRCLRQILYDGLNTDERKRPVFDGMIPHVAGAGLGFFNHRFASPTRHNTQHDEHSYPIDVFPFAYEPQTDPFTGRREGLLDRSRAAGHVPKIMHIQSSAEYWHRSGSLVHTDPLGRTDAVVPPEVRIYAVGGAQHGPGSGRARPAASGGLELRENPTDYRPFLRGLLVALEDWVRTGREPPRSRYPKISDGTLAGWREIESGWAALPSVRYPAVIQQPSWFDYGPDFPARRSVTLHPPVAKGEYRVGVPAYGPDNNERGTLLAPSVSVPVATFTGWNHRDRSIGAAGELFRLRGAYLPFARTPEERRQQGDPRPALLERYRGFDDYLTQYQAALQRLIDERYLLEEDRALWLALAREHQPLFRP